MKLVVTRKKLMISAAAVSSLRVLRMRPAGCSGSSPASPRTSGITADAGLEARDAEGKPREHQECHAHHQQGASVAGEQHVPPVADALGVGDALRRGRRPRRRGSTADRPRR